MRGERVQPHEQTPGSRRTPLIQTTFVPLPGPGRPATDPDKMSLPHQCLGCRKIYDGGRVTVTQRYADCSRWKCPGCGNMHDDRRAWSGGPGTRQGYIDINEARRAQTQDW